jgi:hypothetical protein
MTKLITSLLVCAAATAHADPGIAPGDESGRIDETPGTEDPAGRKVLRGVLLVPKGLVTIVLAPVRLGVWVTDRYDLQERARQFFFNDSGTFGIYPTLRYEAGERLRFGAQMDWRLSYNDRVRTFAGASLDGDLYRFDTTYSHRTEVTALDTAGVYERIPDRRLYEIGNVDSGATRFDSKMARIAEQGAYKLEGGLEVRGAASIASREALMDYKLGYLEAEILYDSRTADVGWDTPQVTSGGSLVSIWAGHETIIDMRDLWRYGTDLQHYVRLSRGPRVLAFRFHGEAIDAPVDEVPVTELPTLGGPVYLRGYHLDRWRDRVAAVATGEYQWDLSHSLFAALFVDVGRVYPALDDLSFEDLRVGYGIALELHAPGIQGIRGSMASSSDGGLFFNFYLEPVFTLVPRVERR